jgi:hypothetical protein
VFKVIRSDMNVTSAVVLSDHLRSLWSDVAPEISKNLWQSTIDTFTRWLWVFVDVGDMLNIRLSGDRWGSDVIVDADVLLTIAEEIKPGDKG